MPRLAAVALAATAAVLLAGAASALPDNWTGLKGTREEREAKFTPFGLTGEARYRPGVIGLAGIDAATPPPAEFSWLNNSGRTYLLPVQNQVDLGFCGSCWAFATSHSLSDRLTISRNGGGPIFMGSPQRLVDCVPGSNCEGGSPQDAFNYLRDHPLPDQSCAPYNGHNGKCTAASFCSQRWSNSQVVTLPDDIPSITVTSAGAISGEKAMMREIFLNGPIACSMDASNPKMQHYDGAGVYSRTYWGTTESTGGSLDHEVEVVGWGTYDGTPYWLVKNSWGQFWGLDGYFRLLRGGSTDDTLGIEESCNFGDPLYAEVKNPSEVHHSTWSE